MKRKIFWSWMYATALLAVVGCGDRPNDGVVSRAGQPDYVRQFDEKAMDKAMADARATWQRFAQALAKPDKSRKAFAIKKGFRVGDDLHGEHIWLVHVTFDGTRFRGEVNNEPVDTKEVKLGDIVSIAPEELSDWMFIENGVLQGGYTLRVLLNGKSPQARKEFCEEMGFRVE